MPEDAEKNREIVKPLEQQAPPEAAQRGGVIGENVNQARWRQTQQAHILEQGESATDLFYDPNFKPKNKSAKFELFDDSAPAESVKQGKFIDYEPAQLDKKTFALGMDHENDNRSGVQKLGDFIDAAARRASDPEQQKQYIQDELEKIVGIGRGLNNAKEHTKAAATAGWTALTDGTVATFLARPNAINEPLFHAVGNLFDQMSKDPLATNQAMERIGQLIIASSENYSKLPPGKQGEVLGETLFYSIDPEGSTEAGELALKVAEQVATKVDAAVVAGIEKSVKAAQEMALVAPELAEQSRAMILDYGRSLGLTPQEMEVAGVPRGWMQDRVRLDDNMFAMSDGKSGFRGDHDFHNPINEQTGKKKSYINADGDLTPADPEGLFKEKPVDVVHHLCGDFYKWHKPFSPYTSLSELAEISVKYGKQFKLTADLEKLELAIQSGEVSGVQLIKHDEVLEMIRNSPCHEYSRKNAMKYAIKDKEILIRGVLPKRFFKVELAE
jgi:hypothetical protein